MHRSDFLRLLRFELNSLVNHIYAKPSSDIVRTLKRTLQTIRGLQGPNAFNLKQPYV